MKKITLLILMACLMLSSAEVYSADRMIFILGPRVGATYIVCPVADFNQAIQEAFPDPDRTYFPFITQFGIQIEQRIRLGDTESHFAFQEVIVLGGLDQNIIIPGINLLVGFRSHFGLEIGLGPNISVKYIPGQSVEIPITVVYAIGWTFSFSDVYVPLNLAVVPTPKDGRPRITLLTGFNFAIGGR